MSSSVLYGRLGELTDAGLIRKGADGRYELTEHGHTLGVAIDPLVRWSTTWSASLDQT
jgi:DNA-binding HxlR family transcriptional regulator